MSLSDPRALKLNEKTEGFRQTRLSSLLYSKLGSVNKSIFLGKYKVLSSLAFFFQLKKKVQYEHFDWFTNNNWIHSDNWKSLFEV